MIPGELHSRGGHRLDGVSVVLSLPLERVDFHHQQTTVPLQHLTPPPHTTHPKRPSRRAWHPKSHRSSQRENYQPHQQQQQQQQQRRLLAATGHCWADDLTWTSCRARTSAERSAWHSFCFRVRSDTAPARTETKSRCRSVSMTAKASFLRFLASRSARRSSQPPTPDFTSMRNCDSFTCASSSAVWNEAGST